MLEQIISLNVFVFLLIFCRVGAAILILPGFSARYVPGRVRLLLALTMSFVLTPVLMGKLPAMPASALALFILVAGEIVIGAFLGTLGRVLVGSLQTAGTVIAYVSSMANAFIQDPISEQQSSMIANFLGTMGVLLIFVTDLHHVALRAVSDSYTLFAPGRPLPVGDFSQMMARYVMDSVRLGVQMAAPFIITGMTYYLGLGLLSRLMPTLHVFFFGLPVQIATQIFILTVTVSGIMMVFLSRFEEGYGIFLVP
jgi:flagellar biosynthesis protein FliR